MNDKFYTIKQIDDNIFTLNTNGYFDKLILPSEAKILAKYLTAYADLYTDEDINIYNLNSYNNFINNINTPKCHTKNKIKRYVYLFKNKIGNYKIGLSSNPINRLQAFNNPGNPVEIVCVSKPIYNAYKQEQILHSKYSLYSLGNEWYDFKNNTTLINCIKQEILDLD